MEILFWILTCLATICAIGWIVAISVKKFRDDGVYFYFVIALDVFSLLMIIVCAICPTIG